MQVSLALAVLFCVAFVAGDLYMHNPRGANNRNNEANVNNQNNNRLWDSQNNAKGGYCLGPAMSYYEGSLLQVEWTNQHGCGMNGKLVCNLVIQYMCGLSDAEENVRIRDGTTTNSITADEAGTVAKDEDGNLLYALHENLEHYQACATRARNGGLWINDRNLNQRNSRSTRQNNNGNRRGLECPEERDYYPYWAPSPWRDVAILTHDVSYCGFYTSESQNVKSRFYCADAEGLQAAPNSEDTCKQGSTTEAPLTWTEVPAFGIPAPDCVQAPWARDNHLGNTGNVVGFATNYNWTLPTQNELPCIEDNNCNCVLRMRYNISVTDLGPDGNRPDFGFIDWTMNDGASPIMEDPIIMQDGQPWELAVDTTQFGRTFQDRSHVFHIRPRPDGVSSSARIFNLNVRGKRGNIVQAYPATEYDFVPDQFVGRTGDYIHFQWTGCDTNPAGNAGEGTASTDRSNMVQIAEYGASVPASDEWLASNTPLFEDKNLRMRMAMLDQTDCLDKEALLEKNNGNNNAAEQDVQNCMKLNAAERYFDGGLVQMNKTGTFYYMSTRNNNFTNRGQKGVIEIIPLLPTWAIALVILGGVLFVLSAVTAGAVLYAKSHPSSGLANTFSKM